MARFPLGLRGHLRFRGCVPPAKEVHPACPVRSRPGKRLESPFAALASGAGQEPDG